MATTDTLFTSPSKIETPTYSIRFPESKAELDQNEEYFKVEIEGEDRTIRFHDYDQIFSTPGLYEQLFHDKLKCQSPELVARELINTAKQKGIAPKDLRVLDFGAGNGLVAEALYNQGVRHIIGADIIPEAKTAAMRDRGHVYTAYHVCDFCDLQELLQKELANEKFNALTTVAALGFDDVPLKAFETAYNLLEKDGLIGFNIRDKFLDSQQDDSGFHAYITQKLADEIEVTYRQTYIHRLNLFLEPIEYEAIIGQKTQG